MKVVLEMYILVDWNAVFDQLNIAKPHFENISKGLHESSK